MSDFIDTPTNKRKETEDVIEPVSVKKAKSVDSESTVNKLEKGDDQDLEAEQEDDEADYDEGDDDEGDDDKGDDEGNDDSDEGEDDQDLQLEKRSSKSSSSKPESSTQADKAKAVEGSDNEDEADISDDELGALDTSLILNTGRRTRGKKIDYTQFGADTPADEE